MYTKLLKSITSLSLIGGALLYTNGSDVRAAEASIFSDVPTSHWSYPAIKDLSSKNIISGYGNGKFDFGDVATREQVSAKQKHTFNDVPNGFWAEGAISAVKWDCIWDRRREI